MNLMIECLSCEWDGWWWVSSLKVLLGNKWDFIVESIRIKKYFVKQDCFPLLKKKGVMFKVKIWNSIININGWRWFFLDDWKCGILPPFQWYNLGKVTGDNGFEIVWRNTNCIFVVHRVDWNEDLSFMSL